MSQSTTIEAPPSKQEEQTKPRRQPPYAVIIINDDFHTFDYVIEVLRKVFGYDEQKCKLLTETVHTQGEAVVWTGTLEVAELKRDQIRSAGPDFYAFKTVKFPLGVRVEPMR
jgi:ATP-dependent Clp protease adaptor protein ClpS